MTEEVNSTEALRPRRMLGYILGLVLLSAVVASWFVWGPFGLIFYVEGLFNSTWIFTFVPLLFLLIPAAVALLPVRAMQMAQRWRTLTCSERLYHFVVVAMLFAFILSFGLGFAGANPPPSDLYARGFARYIKSRADVEAIQNWLGTLDRKDYILGEYGTAEKRFNEQEQPRCIASLRPKWATVRPDEEKRLTVCLFWGGGLIGHWGIVVGPRDMPIPPSDTSNDDNSYFPLAPGAYVWSGD